MSTPKKAVQTKNRGGGSQAKPTTVRKTGSQAAAESKKPGRPPKRDTKAIQKAVYLPPAVMDWTKENLPRGVSDSAFFRSAVLRLIEQIEKDPGLLAEVIAEIETSET